MSAAGDTTIDLRSDAVTQPTDEMWRAMRAAPPHWSADGADPSILALEARGCAATGKEAALFVPTGTMGNLVALMAQLERGDHIFLDQRSHIFWSEEWSFAAICGAVARPLATNRATLDPETLRRAIGDRRFGHRPRGGLVCLENTVNAAGGAVVSPQQTATLAEVAHEHKLAVHLDGARLCNAHIALGVKLSELAEPVDTVMLGLSKGLSAPGGALLCGSVALIDRARIELKRLGGHSLPNHGILAAAATVALDTMVARLAEDHRRASLLAHGIARLAGVTLDPGAVQTNIVMAGVDRAAGGAHALVERLRQRHILALSYTDDVIRFVLHRHISDAMCAATVDAVRDALSGEGE